MRIRKPGKIRDRVWFLGREESAVYLLEGDHESMMVSGGVAYIVPDILRQLDEFGIDESRIRKLLILHAHFDHIGVVPFFKRRHPQMEVYASARGWEILRTPKAVMTINEFSRLVARRNGKEEVYSLYDLEWRDDVTGKTLHEGDKIDLGGLQVLILEIPGHSSCSIAAYVPQLKVLLPSDGAGIPYGNIIVVSGNSNYTKYQENLERLKALEVEYLCADHYGYITGEEAGNYIPKSIEEAKGHRALMEAVYKSKKDVDAAAKELTSSFYSENPECFLAPDIMNDVYRQMVRHIANAMDSKS